MYITNNKGKKMKKIDITVMNQNGNSIFAYSNEEISPKNNGNQKKILGSGNLSSFTELHNELFNMAKSTFKGQEIEISINNKVYGVSSPDMNPLILSEDFPKNEIEKFSNTNIVNFKIEKTPIGMFKITREDGQNLYNLEDEKYLRDRNGFKSFNSEEDALDTLRYYFEEDESQNRYIVQQKDLTRVLVNGESFDEYRNRESINKPSSSLNQFLDSKQEVKAPVKKKVKTLKNN